jgi:hypothetical protein
MKLYIDGSQYRTRFGFFVMTMPIDQGSVGVWSRYIGPPLFPFQMSSEISYVASDDDVPTHPPSGDMTR